MNVTLRPEVEARIHEKLRRGEFESAEALVEQAVAFFLDCEHEEIEADEFHEIQAAVSEGLGQADRGEGISLDDFDRMMRAKHGIQR